MSPQLSRGVVFFVMAILVALFAWIYQRGRQERVGLWMIGWAAILLDFATVWAFTFALLSRRLVDWMEVFTLEVAGACFLFSVSKAFATARQRLFLSCFVILPAIVYWTCLVLAVKETWIYRSLLVLAVGAAVAGVVLTRITSGCNWTSSLANCRARSMSAFVHRCSIRILVPFAQPNRASSWTNTANHDRKLSDHPSSTPTCRTRSPCCARAASGNTAAAPPRRVTKSRRLTMRMPRFASRQEPSPRSGS